MFKSRPFGVLVVTVALVAAACSSDSGEIDGPTIKIGSANFSESALVAEIYAQALEAEGYSVDRKLNIGTREIYKPALESGELDLLPEYIGTMLTFLGGEASSDSAATHSALQAAWEPEGISILDFAPAQDKNGLVVTKATAEELGVSRTSDLANFNGTLVFGGPPECPNREFCLIGLQSLYGLDFLEFKPLDVGGPITVTALESGEIDVALLFTSSGVILAKEFVLLEDDKGLQPAENLAPAVRTEILDAYGDRFANVLNAVSSVLTTTELIALNKAVEVDGEDPDKVAADWLDAQGLS
ncbi:MAG: ABC transporter substrate-binding protein [Acidobacteria bacterium]|nr:ABC transporter substrate-binding protein [Acidobacteriota bacterium]MCH8993265.1 ABC transporter substrate-binding protein [Acidobacteriota bacterium]